MFPRSDSKTRHGQCILSAAFLAVLASCPASAAQTISVSPDGPVKTLEAGLAEARRTGAKEILLAPGTYRLTAPLTLTEKDSGLAVRGAGRGKTVVSGARILDGLEFRPYGNGGALAADLPDAGEIDVLFLNGKALDMARFPNRRPGPGRHVFDCWALSENGKYDPSLDAFTPERVARWKHPETGYAHAMHQALWGDMSWRILGPDGKGGVRMEGGWQNNRPTGMHRVFRYVENIFEELDAPGEWFHDRAGGKLHIVPPEGFDPSRSVFEATRLDRLVAVEGSGPGNPATGIVFSGITFTGTARRFMHNKERLLRSDWTLDREAAVRFTDTRGCAAEDCEFTLLGGNAVMFDGFNERGRVVRCLVREVGANGVVFAGRIGAVREPCFDFGSRRDVGGIDRTPGPKSGDYPRDCAVEDSVITRTGRAEKQTSPVTIDVAARITVRDCSIFDVPRAGINIGNGCFGGHLVTGCDVFDTVLETDDHGSFNSWGRDRFWTCDRNVIAKDAKRFPGIMFADAVEPVVLRGNRMRCDHGWDIDLDDGSSNYIIENNLLLNGGLKLREGYGRTARNNLIVRNTFHLHCWLPDGGDVVESNLVSGAYCLALMEHWDARIDWNLFADGDAAAGRFRDKGCDANSRGFRPLFRNPAAGDYTVVNLPADSPFRNLPTMDYGVKDPDLRKFAGCPKFPVPDVSAAAGTAAGKNLEPFEWGGMTVRRFDGPAEFSAFGLPRDTAGFVVVWPSVPFERNDIIEGQEIPPSDAESVTVIRDGKRIHFRKQKGVFENADSH